METNQFELELELEQIFCLTIRELIPKSSIFYLQKQSLTRNPLKEQIRSIIRCELNFFS